MRLYHVSTIAKEYHGCRDVAFDWFRCERGEPRPYAELIENYDPGDDMGYAEGAIDEMFTEAEAVALKAYLDREHGGAVVTTIKEGRLPLPANNMGVGAIPVGGGDDFYMLNRARPQYDLPFKVWGYFNLVGRELVDGSGVYHHRCYIWSDGGTLRMETNEEAAASKAEAMNRPRDDGAPMPL